MITLSRGLPTAADQCPPAGGRAFWLEGGTGGSNLVPSTGESYKPTVTPSWPRAGSLLLDVTVVEVKYLTWTDENLLRQVVYEGLREDKDPEDRGQALHWSLHERLRFARRHARRQR